MQTSALSMNITQGARSYFTKALLLRGFIPPGIKILGGRESLFQLAYGHALGHGAGQGAGHGGGQALGHGAGQGVGQGAGHGAGQIGPIAGPGHGVAATGQLIPCRASQFVRAKISFWLALYSIFSVLRRSAMLARSIPIFAASIDCCKSPIISTAYLMLKS